MSPTARLSVAFATIAGALAMVVAVAAAPNAGVLLTAVAASAALVAVATVSVRALVAAPAEAALRIGHRGHAHRESFDHLPAPAHPDTAGRVRSRAPGAVVPAA